MLIALGFISVLALNIRYAGIERQASSFLLRTNAWTAWQLEKAYLRFLVALGEYESEPTAETLEDVRVHFEVLYGRPQVVLVGPEAQVVRSLPGAMRTVEGLSATLDEIDATMSNAAQLDQASVRRFHDMLRPYGPDLSRISVSASRGEAAQRLRQNVSDSQEKSFWMELSLVVASALLMLFLTWELIRNRRLAAREARLRRRADETNRALRESEQWHRHLVESTEAIPYRFDFAARRSTYVGPRAESLLGYPGEDWFGADFWRDRLHPGDRERVCQDFARAIDTRSDFADEYRMVTADGRTIWVRDVLKSAHDDEGIANGFGLLFDITEFKLREQGLAQAQKMEAIGQLTGGMAHDFNNLLAIVTGNLELLGLELEGDQRALGLVDRALKAALRGAGLTRQLLGFARRQALEPVDFDVNELVVNTFDLLRRTLGEHIEIDLELAADAWQAFADPVQAESALTNLAINARDAMPTGGRITIETANRRLAKQPGLAPGDYVMIAVGDTGSGIPPDVLPRVFEPFFTTKPKGKGTGLGLSMVFGFVSQSKGHATIESEPGRGTTIRLYFRKGRQVARAGSERPGALSELPASVEGATVLVVEDNADVRAAVLDQLAELGCRLLEADGGAAGLRLVESAEPIDLLFTDIVMPGGMSGIDLAERARALRPDLPILFTSGFYDDATQGERRLSRFGELLRKPYRKLELVRTVREHLARAGQRRASAAQAG